MAANGEDYAGIEAETSFEVNLYIYDLSKELSKSFKKILKGKPLPGIWHTGLVAYGREYYFASSGVESCRPGETILGEPDQILTLGKTELPYSVFLEYVFALGESTYKPGTYNLLEHNCNTFSQEVSSFLTGGPIPQELREITPEIRGNKTLSNSLREYFDKLNFKVEGTKGISFGTVGPHQNGHSSRKSSIDQIPLENQNGEIIVNGQSGSQPSKGHQKSTKSKSSNSNNNATNHNPSEQNHKKPPKMPVVNGETSKDQVASDRRPPEAAAQKETQIIENVAAKELPSAPTNQEPIQAAVISPTADGETAAAGRGNGAVSESTIPGPALADEGGRTPGTEDDEPDTPLPTFTSRRSKKYQDPPILYPDINGESCYKKLMELAGERLSFEEKQAMTEILEYLLCPEGGAWALGAPHLDAIGRLLNDRNLQEEVPVLMLQVMSAAALKEDVILLLHQDREHHHIMSYLYRIENLPEAEQESITTFMCNLCFNSSSFDWLMYISEWLEDGHSCNNSKVTVRVAVHSLLCDNPTLQERGSALIYNLALKELFDDTATELAMAVMQFLHSELNEESAFRSLTALLRFMCISYNDVPALMKMMGPDVRKFGGKSERVDQLVDQIQTKLNVSISA